MKWIVLALLLLSIIFTVSGDGEIWEDEDHVTLVRNARGAQNKGKRKISIFYESKLQIRHCL